MCISSKVWGELMLRALGLGCEYHGSSLTLAGLPSYALHGNGDPLVLALVLGHIHSLE